MFRDRVIVPLRTRVSSKIAPAAKATGSVAGMTTGRAASPDRYDHRQSGVARPPDGISPQTPYVKAPNPKMIAAVSRIELNCQNAMRPRGEVSE